MFGLGKVTCSFCATRGRRRDARKARDGNGPPAGAPGLSGGAGYRGGAGPASNRCKVGPRSATMFGFRMTSTTPRRCTAGASSGWT